MASVCSPREGATPNRPAPPHLLNLPGELRNRIYRHALITNGTVVINDDCFQQPALLCVCSRIRSEAAPIYYSENSFVFAVTRFKSAAVASWWRHGKSKKPEHGTRNNVRYNFSSQVLGTRADFLIWLRRAHQHEVPRYVAKQHSRGAKKQIACIFRTVKLLRDLPWEKVEEVVQNEITLMLLGTHHRFEEQGEQNVKAV